MHHRTHSEIRRHAFCCLLGASLLQSLRKRAGSVRPGLSMEQLQDELRRIQ